MDRVIKPLSQVFNQHFSGFFQVDGIPPRRDFGVLRQIFGQLNKRKPARILLPRLIGTEGGQQDAEHTSSRLPVRVELGIER